MISRRRLFGVVPLIGFLDFDKMPDFEPEEGFSDLVRMDSIGPYLRFAWLDRKDGDLLPHVVATIWAREDPGIMNIGVVTADGYRRFRVSMMPDKPLDLSWLDERYGVPFVQREAVMRLIRVLVRQERGLPVIYKEGN